MVDVFAGAGAPMNADRILPKLWQGARPPADLYARGFRALVLCAEEIQPPDWMFPGVAVFRAPNDDDPRRPPSPAELGRAIEAARWAAAHARAGERTLITCAMGWNRSGLVMAMAVHLLTGASGEACVKHVQKHRPGALGNPQFRRVLFELKKAPVLVAPEPRAW